MTATSLRIVTYVSVLGLFVAALTLRVILLDHLPGLNADEAGYGVQAQELLAGNSPVLRTPTGNVLNPLFFGPVLLAHWLAPASVVTLRSVALVSGILTLLVNWLLCRKVFGGRTAWITTTILAVLPLNIAYSRFAWDTCQTVLVTVPVVYCALGAIRFAERRWRWLAAACVCELLAILVHPANVFAAAAIVVASLQLCPPRRWADEWRKSSLRMRLSLVAAGAALVAAAVAAMLYLVDVTMVADRLTGVDDLMRRRGLAPFLILYPRLLCGGTCLTFLAGSQAWLQWPASDATVGFGIDVLLTWVLLAWAVWRVRRGAETGSGSPSALERGFRGAKGGNSPPGSPAVDRAVVMIWALMLVTFLLAAGPSNLVPGYERYGICLVAPSVLLIGRGLAISLAGRAALTAAVTLAGWFMLADCFVHYHRFIATTGGRADRTFRIAAVEPKQQAVELIAQQAGDEPALVIASEYWLNLPLRYFAAEHANLTIVAADASLPTRPTRLWRVEFADTTAGQRVREGFCGPVDAELTVHDISGRPLISLFRMAPPVNPAQTE